MSTQGRGPRPKPDPWADLVRDLRANFRWLADRNDDHYVADPAGWWAMPGLLSRLGGELAQLFRGSGATVVLGPQSRGSLLGAVVATQLGVGLVEVRKDPSPGADSDRWTTARTPPDYRDRTLTLGVRTDLVTAGQRVLFVDDWIDTGAQALGARAIVEQTGATWIGAAVVIDALADSRLRRDLAVRCLLHVRDL